MNPTNNETNGNKMPPPMAERPYNAQNPDVLNGNSNEQAPVSPEFGQNPVTPSSGQAQPPLGPIPLPIVPTPAPAQQVTPQQPVPTAGLKASDDSDLIEKEWVNKAKMIVERTRDDPYKQSEQLTGVKVDYMKKRYNKAIKLNK